MCSKCVVNLSGVLNFRKKCHDADKILRSKSETKDEEVSVIIYDYTENHILNDHSYENRQKNENSDLEMHGQVLKSEIDIVETKISDVGLDDMLQEKVETDDCNALKQEIITDNTYEIIHRGDNVYEIALKKISTSCSDVKIRNTLETPNKVEKKRKYNRIQILFSLKY